MTDKPNTKIDAADWIEKKVPASDLQPYQRAISDAMQDPDVKIVVRPMKPTMQAAARQQDWDWPETIDFEGLDQ